MSWLRNLKNKKYPWWRFDTFFSKLKRRDLEIIDDGGWHFTNIKSPEALFEKFKNFGHHDEFDESGIDIEFIKSKIKNKEVFYDHFADKTSSEKWKASYKLKKIDNMLLPKYLRDNSKTFQNWFDE